MQKVYNMVGANGSYTNAEGEEKVRWVRIGSVFKREDGTVCAKIDVLPVGGEWNGWVNMYAEEEDKPKSRRKGADFSDDVPF